MFQDSRPHSKEEMETRKKLTVDNAALLAQGFNVRTSGDEDRIEHCRTHAFKMMVWLNAFTTYKFNSESAFLLYERPGTARLLSGLSKAFRSADVLQLKKWCMIRIR